MKRLALVLALAGVVALAAQHAHVWALPLRGWSPDRTAILIAVAVLFGLGLMAAGAIVILAHRAWVNRRPGAPPLRTTLVRALPITTAALALSGLLLIARTDPAPRETADAVESQRMLESSDRRGVPLSINWWSSMVRAGPGEPDQQDPGGAAGTSDPPFSPLIIAMGAVMVIAGAAAWRLYTRRRHGAYELPEETHQEAVHGALVGTIDAMLADPDANTAIRGAYARLLEGLDACGTGRRDHEAPLEHLRRVLMVLHVRPEPLRRLIELFEVARFSTHPLSAAHRDQALRALRDVAADLESDPMFRTVTAGARPGTAAAQIDLGPRPLRAQA